MSRQYNLSSHTPAPMSTSNNEAMVQVLPRSRYQSSTGEWRIMNHPFDIAIY